MPVNDQCTVGVSGLDPAAYRGDDRTARSARCGERTITEDRVASAMTSAIGPVA